MENIKYNDPYNWQEKTIFLPKDQRTRASKSPMSHPSIAPGADYKKFFVYKPELEPWHENEDFGDPFALHEHSNSNPYSCSKKPSDVPSNPNFVYSDETGLVFSNIGHTYLTLSENVIY